MPMRPKAVRAPFNKLRAIPHMSWNIENLYNLWLRTEPSTRVWRDTSFSQTTKTIFQQRWISKRLTKGYHAEHIGAKSFERWFLPASLPRVRHDGGKKDAVQSELAKWVDGKEPAGGRSAVERKIAQMEKMASSPVGTLMFTEVERRIDTLIFRACFATSVWQARTFVVQGHVKINGVVVRNANTLLNPGDIFSVDPKIVPLIQKPTATAAKAEETAEATEESATEETAAEATESEGAEKTEAELAEEAKAAAEAAEAAAREEKNAAKAAAKKAKQDAPFTSEVNGTYFNLPDYASPHLFVPAYLLPSYLTCSAVYIRHPTARPGYSEIPSPYDAGGEVNSLTWEWYQRVAPRMRPNRRARLMNPQRTQDRK